MVSLRSLGLCLLSLAASALARSSVGSSVLVVLEPRLKQADYSLFFNGLKEQGYELTFRAPKDLTPALVENDIPQFAHVVLFAPTSKSFAADLAPQALVAGLSDKTNVLIALSSVPTPLSSLALEFGLTPPPPDTPLISHLPARPGPATRIPISSPNGTVWFEGVPLALGAAPSPMLHVMLRAPGTAFAADTDSDAGAGAVVDAADRAGEGLWAGSALGTVVGFQARGGARVTWAGGVQMFSDEFAKLELKGEKNANEKFCKAVAAWTFQESRVLRIDATSHHKAGGVTQDTYTTNDELIYEIKISEYDGAKWTPTSALRDLQLEFTMLDPHVRTPLNPVASTPGLYRARFRAPDRHGVFKFVVDYRRSGWTYLHSSTTVPVVPPRHDGYPRFLSAAWPYYAGAVSTSAAFVLFCALWLAGDVRDAAKKAK